MKEAEPLVNAIRYLFAAIGTVSLITLIGLLISSPYAILIKLFQKKR